MTNNRMQFAFGRIMCYMKQQNMALKRKKTLQEGTIENGAMNWVNRYNDVIPVPKLTTTMNKK
jgi:hypothetical protein